MATDSAQQRREKLIAVGQAYNLAVKTNPTGTKDVWMAKTVDHFQNIIEASEKLVPNGGQTPLPAGKIRCSKCGVNYHDPQWPQCFKCKQAEGGKTGSS